MKKQTYITPVVTVLHLQHCPLLVSASLTEVEVQGFDSVDNLQLDNENPIGAGGWGR